MDASSQYLSADNPDRANHLWRYTPWKKIHPTGDTSVIPNDFSIPEVSLKTIDGSPLPPGITLDEEVYIQKDCLMMRKLRRAF